MSQQFFLHLGLHKTATTATQNFLKINSGNLLTNDVRYIPLYKMRNDLTPLIGSLRAQKRKMLFNLLESFPNKKIILSDENILGGTGEIKEGDLYHYGKNRVLSFCEEAGKRPVTLFITLREPAAFISSMYCEYLRHSSFISFEEYIANFDLENFSYAHVFSWLKNLPKNTRAIVIPYEAPSEGIMLATAARILKETVGVHAMSSFSPFPEKKSRSSFTQEELDLAATIATQANGKIAQSYLNNLDAQDQRFGTKKFAPFDSSLVQRLNERYQHELGDFFCSMQ
ncbi:MAG: hypothetical protein V4727_08485 [Verrucomicrobiota bacterium]